MNCPNCGKEMSPGWVHGGGRMLWSPKEDKPLPIKGKNDVPLIRDGPPAAFICKACHQVVFSYLDASPYDALYQ